MSRPSVAATAEVGPPWDALPRLVSVPWLVRLRWVAVVGYLGLVAFAEVSALGVPSLGWPVALVGALAASNGLLQLRSRRDPRPYQGLLPAVLLFDVGVLTALLAITGGAGNPFSVLFLVQVTLAAVVLGAAWTWVLVAVTVASFGALFLLVPSHVAHSVAHNRGHTFPNHLQGMWLAYAIAASLIATFVTRIASELRSREALVRELQRRTALNDKLASLSTLAAGAAHELGSPLATIALAAKELERSTPEGDPRTDARLIRTEVERCRKIIAQLNANAGETMGEASVPLSLSSLGDRLQESLGESERARTRVEAQADVTAAMPAGVVVQALRTLVRNGLDAGSGEVRVDLLRAEGRLRFRVSDHGQGMAPEVLARAGEPFFTTKPPGSGMGLGLFLARAVAERLGGSLSLRSSQEAGASGTEAQLDLPEELS